MTIAPPMPEKSSESNQHISTGIEGLDDILHGGLAPNRVYLLEGQPGSGKSTLALQFLMAGARRGEPSMLVTLSEEVEEVRSSARSHGWDLEGIHIVSLLASEESLKSDSRYTMYHPSEVELAETTKRVLAQIEQIRPTRVVFDSISEFRLLAGEPLRYRRQLHALKRFFSTRQCTVLLVDDRTGQQKDMDLHSLTHGVLSLERQEAEYGSMRRRLHVAKIRGQQFREGYHDFVIRPGGVVVFPRLVAAEHRTERTLQELSSGMQTLDALLGGGLAVGTSTLIMGAAGTGKSTLATQFARASAERDDKVCMFIFDEALPTFMQRSAGLGMDVKTLLDRGQLMIRPVDPAELSPGEFAQAVREAVETDGAKMIVIDSLNGYLNAMPSERFLTLHLHELLGYLGDKGVTTIVLVTQHGVVGDLLQVPIDTSYLADSVIVLRYFEHESEIRQAVSVIKKRTGKHERTIREMRIDNGIFIGEPLYGIHGVMSGTIRPSAKAKSKDSKRAPRTHA